MDLKKIGDALGLVGSEVVLGSADDLVGIGSRVVSHTVNTYNEKGDLKKLVNGIGDTAVKVKDGVVKAATDLGKTVETEVNKFQANLKAADELKKAAAAEKAKAAAAPAPQLPAVRTESAQ